MAAYADIDQKLPITINSSRIVISDDPLFVEMAKRTGNDAFLRVMTPVGEAFQLSEAEARALFRILDLPENQKLIEDTGELQCVAMDNQGRDLLSAWIPIDRALELFPVDDPLLGPHANTIAGRKAAGAELFDIDFYKRSSAAIRIDDGRALAAQR